MLLKHMLDKMLRIRAICDDILILTNECFNRFSGEKILTVDFSTFLKKEINSITLHSL